MLTFAHLAPQRLESVVLELPEYHVLECGVSEARYGVNGEGVSTAKWYRYLFSPTYSAGSGQLDLGDRITSERSMFLLVMQVVRLCWDRVELERKAT